MLKAAIKGLRTKSSSVPLGARYLRNSMIDSLNYCVRHGHTGHGDRTDRRSAELMRQTLLYNATKHPLLNIGPIDG